MHETINMNSQTVSEHIIFVFKIWIGSFGYNCLELFGGEEMIKCTGETPEIYHRSRVHLISIGSQFYQCLTLQRPRIT